MRVLFAGLGIQGLVVLVLGIVLWLAHLYLLGQGPSLPSLPTDSVKGLLGRWRTWLRRPGSSLTLAITVGAVIALLCGFYGQLQEPGSRWREWSVELISVSFAVLVIDYANRRRSAIEFKQSVIRQLASRTNNFALEAVEIARTKGWLMDGTLIGVGLGSADLSNADLSHANLEKAKCWATSLWGARLWGTNLKGAYMGGCVLIKARMEDAKLQRAELSAAGLYGAVLVDAKMQYTNLLGARFRGELPFEDANLTGAQLDFAVYDSKTVWPEGYDPKAAGAINKDELTIEKWQGLLELYARQGVEWATGTLRIQAIKEELADIMST